MQNTLLQDPPLRKKIFDMGIVDLSCFAELPCL